MLVSGLANNFRLPYACREHVVVVGHLEVSNE